MDEFKKYWLDIPVPDRKAFAVRCGTTDKYLNMVAHGQKRRVGENLAIAIDRETGGCVRCEQLRPDVDWAYLRGTAGSPEKAIAPECASGDPRHAERRAPDQRLCAELRGESA